MEIGNTTAIVRSYAKVNLTLDVLGTRADGYHAIESVMQSVSLHDTITLSLRDEPGICITCDMSGIPTDEKNLAHKAASLLFESRGISTGLAIDIEKQIPVQAGLGGGSSNAASVLGGLSSLLGLSMSQAELCDLAARVGSDVPFFIVGGTAFVRGRGEEVEPMPDILTQWLVILKPPFGVPTPWAYRRLDETRKAAGCQPLVEGERITASARMHRCIQSDNCTRLPDLLSNDLELPVIEQHPEIGRLKEDLLRAGAKGGLLCGSGSAVFGLFPSEHCARHAADSLAGDYLQVFACRTVTRQEASEIG